MKFENTQVFNVEGALRAMRMPMMSHNKSDSFYGCDSVFGDNRMVKCKDCILDPDCQNPPFHIGKNDLRLARNLIKSGSEHRKFLRSIFVSTEVKMPMYVAAEFDTYKLGTTRNSSSFQHKGTSKPFERSDFEDMNNLIIDEVINELNRLRGLYLATKDYKYFVEIRKLLPASYIYAFAWSANYEVVWNMYNQRCVHPHRLKDWNTDFKNWAEGLPYFRQLFLEEYDMRGN